MQLPKNKLVYKIRKLVFCFHFLVTETFYIQMIYQERTVNKYYNKVIKRYIQSVLKKAFIEGTVIFHSGFLQ